jgi:Uma2 family endonuclease
MSTVVARSWTGIDAPAPVVLEAIRWNTYTQLLRDTESSGRRVFLTYDRGTLEMMAPLPTHERWNTLFRWVIESLSDEWGISTVSYGSTTLRRADLEKGLEPDNCFYVRHAASMVGRDALDLGKEPPPDLAIEIDVTHRSVAREPIYAALGVPELWRFDLQHVEFRALPPEGTYQPIRHSIAFPSLESARLDQFLASLPTADDPTLRRAVRQWVRRQGSDA